ncbi:MAG: ABC-F family ATP-binding cassette domain-containing protein, partial [Oscillospiraceae bacterium]|nr:ABC-F family ATP-binding cassette domain-containing protein [Oscillospiraceae bacterium]
LDEPTNHLDIASREWMEEAIEDYGGTLIFVSHDRYFINRFATRIWELKDGKITDFKGDYSRFKQNAATAVRQERIVKETVKKEKPQKRKNTGSVQKQLAKLEREIAANEELKRKNEELKEQYSTDYAKLMELEEETVRLSEILDAQYSEWESLAEQEDE